MQLPLVLQRSAVIALCFSFLLLCYLLNSAQYVRRNITKPLLHRRNLSLKTIVTISNRTQLPLPVAHPPPSTRRRMVLVMSEARSGSTWLMNLLAFPPNTVSFFEPLNTHYFLQTTMGQRSGSGGGYNKSAVVRWRRVTLSRICTCDVTGSRDREVGFGVVAVPPVPATTTAQHRNGYDVCRKRRTIKIVKTIRLYDIGELEGVVWGGGRAGCPNLQVIHLVRDPRAVLHSRMITFSELYDGNHDLGPKVNTSGPEGLGAFSDAYVARAAADLCGHGVANYHAGRTLPWLRGRYTLVRYEDLVYDPEGEVQRLYRITGLPFNADVTQFVADTTHLDSGSNYGFYKNTKEIFGLWRRNRDFVQHIPIINRVCSEFYETFGYDPDF